MTIQSSTSSYLDPLATALHKVGAAHHGHRPQPGGAISNPLAEAGATTGASAPSGTPGAAPAADAGITIKVPGFAGVLLSALGIAG